MNRRDALRSIAALPVVAAGVAVASTKGHPDLTMLVKSGMPVRDTLTWNGETSKVVGRSGNRIIHTGFSTVPPTGSLVYWVQ